MAWTFRTGQPSDLDALLRLWRLAEAEPTRTDDRRSLDKLLERDPSALLVAEEDGRLVGSVIATWDGWRGTVYRLVVAPECRRAGLGTRLLRQAETRLRSAGAVRLQAVVVESAPAAVGFWRASGWQQQVDRVRFVKD